MGDDVNYLNTKGSYSHSSSGLQEGDTGSYWEGRTLHRALCCTAVTGTRWLHLWKNPNVEELLLSIPILHMKELLLRGNG